MRKYILGFGALIILVFLPGCQSSSVPTVEAVAQPEVLAESGRLNYSIEELLSRPRSELAQLGEEWLRTIQVQERAHRDGKLPYLLLPNLNEPLMLPVWREASYRSDSDLTLPSYVPLGNKDSVLALHLARHGDVEAARRLVEPEDAVALKQIEGHYCAQNYPLEWTRLAAMLLHTAQLRLAEGNPDGLKHLFELHRQLQRTLDPAAARGALGVALLPRGQHVLAQAMTAATASHNDQLASLASKALADWGELPGPLATPWLGMQRNELVVELQSPDRGRVIAVPCPLRVLDVWALPLPTRGLETAFLSLNAAGGLAELVLVYGEVASEYYAHPAELVGGLADRAPRKGDPKTSSALSVQLLQLGDIHCEVAIAAPGACIGALVRLRASGETEPAKNLPRVFGVLSLDLPFRQNALLMASKKRAEIVKSKKAALLSRFTNPVPALNPAEIVAQGAPGQDQAASLSLNYQVEPTDPFFFFQLVSTLWTTAGPPRLQGGEDQEGKHLAIVWEDERTSYTLRLPFDSSQPVQFEAANRQSQ
jgi:hypothetical protein